MFIVDTYIMNTIIDGEGTKKTESIPTIRMELWPRLLGESQLRQSKIHSGWII